MAAAGELNKIPVSECGEDCWPIKIDSLRRQSSLQGLWAEEQPEGRGREGRGEKLVWYESHLVTFGCLCFPFLPVLLHHLSPGGFKTFEVHSEYGTVD